MQNNRTIEGVADRLAPSSPRDNTKAHVSELISKVLEETYDEERPQWANNIMSFGRIWEEAVMRPILEQEAEVFAPNVTLERDGIIGTMDGICYTNNESFVWECKTRFRPLHPPRDYDRWMFQVKAYCHMARTNKAWLTVLHVSARPPNTELVWHELEFSDQELEDNWTMLKNARDYNP